MVKLMPNIRYFMQSFMSIRSQSITGFFCTSDFHIAAGFMPTQLIASSESTLIQKCFLKCANSQMLMITHMFSLTASKTAKAKFCFNLYCIDEIWISINEMKNHIQGLVSFCRQWGISGYVSLGDRSSTL